MIYSMTLSNKLGLDLSMVGLFMHQVANKLALFMHMEVKGADGSVSMVYGEEAMKAHFEFVQADADVGSKLTLEMLAPFHTFGFLLTSSQRNKVAAWTDNALSGALGSSSSTCLPEDTQKQLMKNASAKKRKEEVADAVSVLFA